MKKKQVQRLLNLNAILVYVIWFVAIIMFWTKQYPINLYLFCIGLALTIVQIISEIKHFGEVRWY